MDRLKENFRCQIVFFLWFEMIREVVVSEYFLVSLSPLFISGIRYLLADG